MKCTKCLRKSFTKMYKINSKFCKIKKNKPSSKLTKKSLLFLSEKIDEDIWNAETEDEMEIDTSIKDNSENNIIKNLENLKF